MEETNSSNDADEMMESTEKAFDPMSEPVMLAAAASVAFSWYLFYMKGDKVHGLFVGLWAPTLIGAASYLKQLKTAKKLDSGLSFR
jgi:hypothetical protein